MTKNDIKTCYLLYNPTATGFKDKKLIDIEEEVKKHNIIFEGVKSEYPGHIIKLISDIDNDNSLIITLGGDGTVGEAYKAYHTINQKGLYSHIPSGTTNDMAKNYDVIQKDPAMITADILNGEVETLDTYSVNDHIAAYTSAFGYVAHVPYVTNPFLKRNFGHAGYVIAATPYLLHRPKKYNITYKTENTIGNDDFILGSVSNSNGFGGIDLFKNVSLSDGKIELLLLKSINPNLVKELFKAYIKNDIDITKYKDYIVTDSSKNITLTFNDTHLDFPVDVDGENSMIYTDSENPTLSFKVEKPIKVLKRKEHW